jgi:type IX secretion system PorP/SprF family membrane protein
MNRKKNKWKKEKPYKKKWLRKSYLMVVYFLIVCFAEAQDLHFSQYFNTPLLVNPANTGFAPDVDWRAGINYRNQWSNISNNPYKTMSIWGDAQLFNNRFENGWLGVGGAILHDVAGSGELSATRFFGSVAYHQLLGFSSLLSAGFNIGWITKKIDPTKLTFDNQWNGKFFDITIPSGETFAYNQVGYFDLQAGLNYAYFPNENTYLNAGFSASHINRPTESFFTSGMVDAKLDVRYTVFGNAAFKLNEQWIINPNIYYSRMGNTNEVVLGMNANYNLSGDGVMQLIGGAYYRSSDAIIPMVGYQWKDFKITINYDATVSSLSSYNQSRGAYELSLVKTGLYSSGEKAVKCPTVKF